MTFLKRTAAVAAMALLAACVPTRRPEVPAGPTVAFESVTQKREPFPLTSTVSFSADNRTRIMLFATNLIDVTVMPKFTRLQQALIRAEADMHLAIGRADHLRRKYLLLREKEKIAEQRRALIISKGGNYGYHGKYH